MLPSVAWRRAILYTHRWLGIAGGLLFFAWFVSGIVMIYARMPYLDPAERLRRLPELDLGTALVPPASAARALPSRRSTGLEPERLRIGTLAERPVYRFAAGSVWTTVFADDGVPLSGLTRQEALDLARRFARGDGSSLRYDARLEAADQWTLQSRAFLPLHRIAVDDADGTRLYVSDRTGEVVMKTTRRSRRWAYLGAVVHWLYFTPFRQHSGLWLQAMIWISIAGCLLALSGLVWGACRFSPRGRYGDALGGGRRSPYSGAMRWHHYAGLLFGLFTFTWVLSGCLSLDPWSLNPGTTPTREQRQGVAGGRLRLEALTVPRLQAATSAVASSFAPKELDLVQFQGEPFLLAYRPPPAARPPERAGVAAFLSPVQPFEHRLVPVLDPGHGAVRFGGERLLAAARAAMPQAEVETSTWLEEHDGYYYDRYSARPLPVLRVRFADPPRTWLYLDPGRGLLLHREESLSRLNRWLYHGLHSLDFPFLYERRRLRDAILILLGVGGIVLSASSMAEGWRRARRHLHRLLRRPRRWDG